MALQDGYDMLENQNERKHELKKISDLMKISDKSEDDIEYESEEDVQDNNIENIKSNNESDKLLHRIKKLESRVCDINIIMFIFFTMWLLVFFSRTISVDYEIKSINPDAFTKTPAGIVYEQIINNKKPITKPIKRSVVRSKGHMCMYTSDMIYDLFKQWSLLDGIKKDHVKKWTDDLASKKTFFYYLGEKGCNQNV